MDSIYAENGLRVVEFENIPRHCGPEDVPVRFVEGLGPNFDFKYFLTDWEEEYVNLIRCHTKDSTVSQYMPFYGDGDCTNAGPTNTDEHHSQDATDLQAPFPNPVQDFLQIGHIPFERYNLYDRNGKVVLSGSVQNQINMAPMQQGLYFLDLINSNNRNYSYKIIKQ